MIVLIIALAPFFVNGQTKAKSGVFTYVKAEYNIPEDIEEIYLKNEKGEEIVFHHSKNDEFHFETKLFNRVELPLATDSSHILTRKQLIGNKYDILYYSTGGDAKTCCFKIADIIDVNNYSRVRNNTTDTTTTLVDNYKVYLENYNKFKSIQTSCEAKNKATPAMTTLDAYLAATKNGPEGLKKFITPSNQRALAETDKLIKLKAENAGKYNDKWGKYTETVAKNKEKNKQRAVLYIDENTCLITWGGGLRGAGAMMKKVGGKWYVEDPFNGDREFKDLLKGIIDKEQISEKVILRYCKEKYNAFYNLKDF